MRPVGLSRIITPTALPVTLGQAKTHLRVTISDEDADIADKLAAAVEDAQSEAGLQCLEATFTFVLDDFPRAYSAITSTDEDDAIYLPVGPLVAVESITYRDPAGASQTLSASTYFVGNLTGRVVPKSSWPATEQSPENVVVRFRAGFADSGQVPSEMRSAILLILGHRFENRGDEEGGSAALGIPPAASRLLAKLRSRIQGGG